MRFAPHHRARSNRRPLAGEERLHRALSPEGEAPDLTARIMSRLGYQHGSSSMVQRRRRSRWLARAGSGALALMAIFVAAKVYMTGPDVRRPEATTMPDAVIQDLHHHRRSFNLLINTLQSFTPPQIDPIEIEHDSAPEPADAPCDDVLRRSTDPYQWV